MLWKFARFLESSTKRPKSMKKNALVIVLLLCVPAVIVVTAILNRPEVQRSTGFALWFEQLKVMDSSSNLEVLKGLGESAVPRLVEALKSRKKGERFKAAWALGQLGTAARSAVPEITQALNDEDPGVRINATQALSAIGVVNGDLVPILLPRLKDKDMGMSSSAADLLTRIEADNLLQFQTTSSNYFDYTSAFLHATSPRARLMSLPKLRKLPQDEVQVRAAYEVLLSDTNGWVRDQTKVFLAKK